MKQYTVFTIYSNELQRNMRVFLMVPKSYSKSIKKYPVLYMHDGVNLFDDKSATFGKSWGILEAYETEPNLPELIIVGIDTDGTERSNLLVPFEFNFKDNKQLFGGQTDAYLSFIINTLKPLIDSEYRTFRNAKNTGIMGSSFGGLCSTYAALEFSDHFTRFGCVSNAYYVVQQEIEALIKSKKLENIKRFYMDVGTKETSSDIDNNKYISSNQKVHDLLSGKLNKDTLQFKIVDGAIHNEKDWELRFPDIIRFLFN